MLSIGEEVCIRGVSCFPSPSMQVGGAGLAVIDKAEAGPQFGAEGLTVPLQPGQERLAKSRLGTYYARRADGGRSLFAAGEEKRAQLTDLKVCMLSRAPANPNSLISKLLVSVLDRMLGCHGMLMRTT